MKFLFASAALVALAQAKEYPITGTTVNCREEPTTDSPVSRTYTKDDKVTLTCQVEGAKVSGTAIWDKTTDGCYVTDYFVKTDSKKFVADTCDSSSASGSASGSASSGSATDSSSTAKPTSGHNGNSTMTTSKGTTSIAIPTGGNVTITTTSPPSQTTEPGESGTTSGGAATTTTAAPGGAAVLEKGLYVALPVALAAVAQLL